MRVSPMDISPTAVQKEQEHENDFFKLLFIADKQQTFSSCRISQAEWRITSDCLDQVNYRYADYFGLLSFAVFYPMHNRLARGVLARYRLPLYLSLVGYDCGLRATSQYPAITYWNSICMLNSDMGNIARTLNSPESLYEVVDKSAGARGDRPPSFLTWLGDTALFAAESLLLRKLLSHTFADSCWMEEHDENTKYSSFVINSRFFRWRLLDAKLIYERERVIYEINTSLFPVFGFSQNMRRSYRCRHLIMERSSVGARLWYGSNFALMRLFSVERS